MFTIEQYQFGKLDFWRKKRTFSIVAHDWSSMNNMFKGFTYKELTLIFGIIVACIVILTLWLRQPLESFLDTSGIPGISKFETLKDQVVENYVSAFEELLSSRSNPY